MKPTSVKRDVLSLDISLGRVSELRLGRWWVLGFLLAHATANAQVGASWVTHNRYVEFGTGRFQQAYIEQDNNGRTSDGILNSETGGQNALYADVRWQSLEGWLVELTAERQSGPTDYRGYLQSGGSLTPYNARTGNVANQTRVQLGYALNAVHWSVMSAHWQFIPVVQFSQHQWERNLVQYSETYRFNAYAVGAIAQWQVRPGTVLEVQAGAGRTKSAKISVPALGFEATQPGGNLTRWQLAITQDIGAAAGKAQLNGWRAFVRYAASRYSHDASPVVNGLQAPPNENTPNSWMLGVQKQF